MTNYAYKSMLQRTMAPVVLVVMLWVTMSSATTYYVQWLERDYERIFLENFGTIRAAETMQILVWRLVVDWPDDVKSSPSFRLRWRETKTQIEEQRQKLVRTAFSEVERQAVANLNHSVDALLECLQRTLGSEQGIGSNVARPAELAVAREQILEIAGRIAAATNELLKINQDLADQGTKHRRQISRLVISARLAMMIIGPILGVLLGWRMSRMLHHSFTRIAVTLHDAGSNSESAIGTIAIEPSGDFREVQQQAEKVVERMRQVSLDLQNARREVMQSERLAAVGELAAGVAHEIRNPLTSVKLLLQHAIRQASGPRLDESQIDLILEEIGRMESTVQGLLDFSRPPRLNRVSHDLRQTIQRALNLVEARARQQRIDVNIDTGDAPLIVDGDTEKLHQVFVNLFINAIEAMMNGGCLTIDTAVIDAPASAEWTPSMAGGETGRQIVIRIQDTGEGIPGDVLTRLFEPFATSKERGTGLGLAVSRRIIEEHRGTILARNREDGGAEFTVRIPEFEAVPIAGATIAPDAEMIVPKV